MPCCESEMQLCSAEYTQTPSEHGTANLQLQGVNIDSTPNETCARSCTRSTSAQVQSMISEMVSAIERDQRRSSSTVASPAPPRRMISNARFSVCPNNTQDIQCYRTSPVALTSGGGRYSPFWNRSCEEQFRQSWYPIGTDWHDSVSSLSNSFANLTGANSWFTMKWKLHPGRGLFRTCSTSCTSTIVESREQESTSRKRKRKEKEKSEEEKQKIKEARMLKARQQKEERLKALEKMKADLGSRESLTIPIDDPEELKKIERKQALRQRRILRKQCTENSKPTVVKKPQRTKGGTITKSFSVRIKPTNDQKQILNHWIGCARFTYNEGLSIVKDYTSKEERPSINEALFETIKGQLVPYDKVDRDKPWLHNCPEKIRAYAVHKELYRTYKSNFERGVQKFEPKFRNKHGLQSIHMPKDKVVYCQESQTLRLFPNHKMKTEHFQNLSGGARESSHVGSGEYHIFGPKFRKTRRGATSGERKRSKKKIRVIERCFKENGKAKYDVTFVRTATNKYELRLTFDESIEDVQQRNLQKNPSKKFDSVFIDPGNRTFSTMYSPEGFSGSIGDKDISRIFGLLKTHDELQSEGAKKSNNRTRGTGDVESGGDDSTTKGDPNSLNGESRIQLAVIREKIKNLRDEVHWQTISFLLRNFKNIFIPKLDTKHMVLKGSRKLNKTAVRQMLTWSHGLFIERLVSKSREFRDTYVHIVDECYTSKTCGGCGTMNESLGTSKWFSCNSCGFECERDLNGARNVFIKAVCEGVLAIS